VNWATFFIPIFIFVAPVFAEERDAKETCQYEILDQIEKITRVKTEDDVIVKLIETSGGDPAMNGNVILLSISEDSNDGKSYDWETGINMLDIQKIKGGSNHSFFIEGIEDYLDEEGLVKQRPVNYLISYSFTKGHLDNRINVAKVN